MAKKDSSRQGNSPRQDKARRSLRKLGLIFLNFVLFYALFRILLELALRNQAPWLYYLTTVAYGAAACGLFIAFFVLNGFRFDNRDRTADELPAGWSDEEKADFLAAQPGRRARAKTLLYVLLPIVLVLLISVIELSFFG